MLKTVWECVLNFSLQQYIFYQIYLVSEQDYVALYM